MRRIATLSVSLAAALAGSACEPLAEDGQPDTSDLVSSNGLSLNGLSLNGLSMNGLSMNGLSLNGLSLNGLSLNGLSLNGFMTTDGGRKLAEYIVKCALPDGHDIVKQDQYGNPYTLHGHLGLAPGWENGACDGPSRRWVSACMLAHVNTAGVHIPINIVGQNAGVGWGQDPNYPNQEGTFFGNIFELNNVGLPDAYYCNGPGFDKDVVEGRVGAKQPGAPYRNLFASGYCHLNGCVPSDAMTNNVPDGYKACGMGEGPMSAWNETLTVWRQNKSYNAAGQLVSGQTADGRTIRYDFEAGVNGWSSSNTQLVLSSSNQTLAQSGSKFLKAVYNSGASTVRMKSPTNLALAAGTQVSFYLYLASDSKLTYINPFVTKAGGNEWKVSNPVSAVLKGSWNVVTITVPAGATGTQVGVEFKTAGAFNAYVDAITW
jgi:hypothetical protein